MLDINWISDNIEEARELLQLKGCETDLSRLIALNKKRKSLQYRIDESRGKQKEISANFKTSGDKDSLREAAKQAKKNELALLAEHENVVVQIQRILLLIPNIPHTEAPRGGAEDNKVVRVEGEAIKTDGRDYIALCDSLGLDVIDKGVKISGSGFGFYVGQAAKIIRALTSFMLDYHTEHHGYLEVSPPYLVNRQTMTGTGQLPKMADDMYHCEKDDLFLIPTAEVPVTNYFRDEILTDLTSSPIRLTAYTPCFRREAGSHGKNTRGLMRLHQFDKVELVQFCDPRESERQHQEILSQAEHILKLLGIEYRVIELATGDMSFSASRCFDIEAWAPVTGEWLEVSSVSNFRDFQARRANIRHRIGPKKVEFVHTLNGSGLALPRVIICLLEKYQNKDGSIAIPEILKPYFGGDLFFPR